MADIYKRVLDLEDAQKRFGMALSKIHDEIVEIRDDMKLLTSNEDVQSLANFAQSIKADLQSLEQRVNTLQTKLNVEAAERQAGDTALSTNISGSNSRITTLESTVSSQGTQINNNTTSINTINSNIANIQSAANSLSNIKAICQKLAGIQYTYNYTIVGPSDGNGFLRVSNSSYGGSNDNIISIVPYDTRSSGYTNIIVGWTDYQNDTSINLQGKWIDGGWVSNCRFQIFYRITMPTYGMPV